MFPIFFPPFFFLVYFNAMDLYAQSDLEPSFIFELFDLFDLNK